MARPRANQKTSSKRRANEVPRGRRTARAPKGKRSLAANPREGSRLDDFLRSEGIYERATNAAIKETIAWQIARAMEKLSLTKTEMAERMGTSRAALDRLLDPRNESVTLATLLRAAEALGAELMVSLIPARVRTA